MQMAGLQNCFFIARYSDGIKVNNKEGKIYR